MRSSSIHMKSVVPINSAVLVTGTVMDVADMLLVNCVAATPWLPSMTAESRVKNRKMRACLVQNCIILPYRIDLVVQQKRRRHWDIDNEHPRGVNGHNAEYADDESARY